jgi:hypothetical protein
MTALNILVPNNTATRDVKAVALELAVIAARA